MSADFIAAPSSALAYEAEVERARDLPANHLERRLDCDALLERTRQLAFPPPRRRRAE